jgi:hypothetical protein
MDDDVVVRREERGLILVLTMEYRPSTKPWRAPSPRKAWLDLEVVQCGYCQAGQIMAIRKDQQFSCELADWYRAFAERAGNPAIWRARDDAGGFGTRGRSLGKDGGPGQREIARRGC